MFNYETVVPVGHEAERVTTAFYRFLETRSAPPEAEACVHTEILGAEQRCTVSLWSEQAIDEFKAYLDRFRPPRPAGLFRTFGRFDRE